MTNLGALRALYGLGETLASGSGIRLGFQLFDLYGGIADRSGVQDDIEGCLYNTGAFDSVSINLTETAATDYLLIQAQTATDFGAVEHAAQLIEGQVRQCLPSGMTITRVDALAIDYRPVNRTDAAAPRGAYGQTQCPPGTQAAPAYLGLSTQCQPIGGAPGAAARPGKCNYAQLSIGDYLACQMGVTPTMGLAIGVIGVLVAITVIKKGI